MHDECEKCALPVRRVAHLCFVHYALVVGVRRVGSSIQRRIGATTRASVLATTLVTSLLPRVAHAQETSADASAHALGEPASTHTPVHELWPVWLGSSAAALGLGLGLYLMPGRNPSDPSISVWRGGLLLDDSTRSVLRATSVQGENVAATASDYLLGVTMANALLVDGIGLPLLRGDPDLAWQATLAYGLALGAELSLGGIVKDVSMRARPYESQCATDPSLPLCQSAVTYQSFFSLHTGVAFTSAGFSCAMHLEQSLYDDQGADIVACGSSIAAASTVGVLRIVADAHYLSDVLVGALTGFLLGYLVPLAILPHRHARLRDEPLEAEPEASAPALSWSALPMIDPGTSGGGVTLGASVLGTF